MTRTNLTRMLLSSISMILLAALVVFPAPTVSLAVVDASVYDEDFSAEDDFFSMLALDDATASPVFVPASAMTPSAELPSRVDNSLSKYFPPIIQQKGGSCGQASGIHYTLAYEMNLVRDLDSRLIENQYPDHWTWNCLNGATGGGSRAINGWAIVKEIGIPTLDVYGDKFSLHDGYGWPSGYDKYYAAMMNRVESFGTIPATNLTDLNRIKGYLYNRNDPSQKYGGLMNYRIFFGGRKTVKIPDGSHEAGKTLITAWGTTGAHGMTYVGYDDNVCFDLNGDGKITNDVDITKDGKVDLADWERGAFIWANSHGLKSGEAGKGYVLYSLAAHPKEKGRGDVAYWVKVKKEYQPRTTMMVRLKFDDRSALKLSAGYAPSAHASKPTKTFDPGVFNGKFNVGKVPLLGKNNSEAIEIGIDLTDIAGEAQSGTFFLSLDRKTGSIAKGELEAACVYHYDEAGRVMGVQNFWITGRHVGESRIELAMGRQK